MIGKTSSKKKDDEMKSFADLIVSVGNKVITIKAKANEKGHLFKSVSPHDVVTAIKELSGIEVEEKSLVMEHIKSLGSYKVLIKKGDQKGECEVMVIGN